MYKIILLLFILIIPSFGFEPEKFSSKFSGKKIDKKISPANTYQNKGKPDIAIENITTYLQRGSMIGSFNGPMYINEPLELEVRVKNIFAEYGDTKKKFKIKVQFRYGYSAAVHKEKIVTVRKNLEPGEQITKRIVYGKVKNTPDILFIKVIADSQNVVEESNENNNIKEISIRIKDPN